MPEFIPGLSLSEAYYREAVRPILDAHFPGLPHSAALIGYGSDVLGLDTPVSRDHMWGPRLLLFLSPEQAANTGPAVHEALRQHLPVRFRGYSTHFSKPDMADGGVRVSEEIEHGPVEHLVFIQTVADFWNRTLGVDPQREPSPQEWLTFSEQALLECTAGRVFHDDLGLEAARRRFSYYPRDVWLYLLAAQWSLISQEEAFIGRTWQAGDALGSRILALRMLERLGRLCFMMERRYVPYSKWFGTALKTLRCFDRIGPLFEGVLQAQAYPEMEPHLALAYSAAAEMHNALQITPPLEPRTRTYSGWHALRGGVEALDLDDPCNTRPHQVIFGGRFVDVIRASICDPQVLALPEHFGSVDQFLTGSSDALQNLDFRRALRTIL